MRVLMLTQFYLPVLGGEELLVRNLSLALTARGHEVAVVTLAHEAAPSFEVDNGVRIYRVPSTTQRAPWLYSDASRRSVPPCPDPGLTWGIREVLARERPDVVHAHNWMVHSFLPLKHWSEARLILSLHDYSLRCATKSFMYHGAPCSGPAAWKCLECSVDHYGPLRGLPTLAGVWTMGLAERASVDMFLPVSRSVASASGLVDSGLPYEIVPGFVPDDISQLLTDNNPWCAQLPTRGYVLFVGGLRRVKGIEVLLRAYSRLKNAPPLVVVGYTCPEPQGAITFPPEVLVLQNWPNDAVMCAWRKCLFGVVPSIWADPCPIVVMEAMRASRPVIASRIGGLADQVVDGETGMLVPPNDVEALRHALERLLADGALRERMGEAAGRRAHQFLASTVVSRIESVYANVLSHKPTHPELAPLSS